MQRDKKKRKERLVHRKHNVIGRQLKGMELRKMNEEKRNVLCEYPVNGRFCGALTEEGEGKQVRSESCTAESEKQ